MGWMVTSASEGKWEEGLEEQVPVHGNGDRAFVVLPGGAQVRSREVGGVKPPSSLRARRELGG